jgi:hypothetical protein
VVVLQELVGTSTTGTSTDQGVGPGGCATGTSATGTSTDQGVGPGGCATGTSGPGPGRSRLCYRN